ncbi:MAG: hypothetical protein ABI700_16925 [Chloroflexota bacterium]
MLKRVLFLGLFALLTFMPAAAQDNPPLLLISTSNFKALTTTVSALNVETGAVEDSFKIDSYFTNVSLSPTGDKLVYYTVTPSNVYLDYSDNVAYYLRDVFGSTSQEIADHGYMDRDSIPSGGLPSWSSDGTRLVVTTKKNLPGAGMAQFNLIDTASGETLQSVLTKQPPVSYQLSWSPDDKYLAYFSEECGHCGIGHVFLLPATLDTPQHPVFPATEPRHFDESLFGWLPNSREVLVIANTGNYGAGIFHWWRVNVDTGSELPVNMPTRSGGCGMVLLDRKTALVIGFGADGNSYSGEVMDFASDGSDFPVLVDARAGGAFNGCRWRLSPDLKQVAFPVSLEDHHYAIRVFDLFTGEQTAQIETPGQVGQDTFYNPSLFWTPDEDRLVFEARLPDADAAQIFTVKADGSEAPQAVPLIDQALLRTNATFIGWVQKPQ